MLRTVLRASVAGSLIVSANGARAAIIRQHYDLALPGLTTAGSFARIEMAGGIRFGRPGEPSLPAVGARILLPAGEVVTGVSVYPMEGTELHAEAPIEPAQPPVPLSSTGPLQWVPPDPAIYASDAAFPGRFHDDPQVGLFRGYRILTLALHPVLYHPASGRLDCYRSVDVEVRTEPDPAAYSETASMIRKDATTLMRLAGIIENPEMIASYESVLRRGEGRDLDPATDYNYLIITTEPYEAGCAPLADYETRRGHRAGVFLRSWITSRYDGVDDPEKIRAFIQDAYRSWNVDYVLLVGDTRKANGIPHRGFYATASDNEADDDIPADMYYGCLDGDWNADRDTRWGEPAEADLYFEVSVGRACIDDTISLRAWVTKTIRYGSRPVRPECMQALMAGEYMWDDPMGNPVYSSACKEEVRLGSTSHGHTTAGFPPNMLVAQLYDSDQDSWSPLDLVEYLNGGMNIVNHMGHANVQYGLKMDLSNLELLTNDGLVHLNNFVYSQGCYCGSFDNRTTQRLYIGDCFAEHMERDVHGAIALVMNSRYGWGDVDDPTGGASQYFDREFFDAIFGERLYPIGMVNDDSKMDLIWAIDHESMRWVYYELNLFGDPALELWTAAPQDLSVEYPASILVGAGDYQVTVRRAGGQVVAGARVTLYSDGYAIYATGLTDTQGTVVFHPSLTMPGTLDLQVTAHDFVPFHGTTCIETPDGPFVVLDRCDIVCGDGSDRLRAGETASMRVVLQNLGNQGASNVTATLETDDPFVQLPTDAYSVGSIGPGETVVSVDTHVVHANGDTPDGHIVPIRARSRAAEGEWSSAAEIPVIAPMLLPLRMRIDDSPPSGNGNGGADPGETIFLYAPVRNVGQVDALDLVGSLSCDDPDVTIEVGQGGCLRVPAGGEAILSGFQVRILSGCPDETTIDFRIAISGASEFAAELTFPLSIGGWTDDAEIDRGWALGLDDDTATNGRWGRGDPVGTSYGGHMCAPEDDHTADPGAQCFMTENGGPGEPADASDVDGGYTTLVSPAFDLSDALSATLSYWRWFVNDIANNGHQDYWTVEVTADGTSWVPLEHTLDQEASWSERSFDLQDYLPLTDRVRVRFVADDEWPGTLVECAVDDLSLRAVRATPSGVDASPPLATRLVGCGPNPFSLRTAILFTVARPMKARLDIVDVGGRVVRRLRNGPVEAGSHSIIFDGRDRGGRPLPSGIYFVRLDTDEALDIRQISLLR